MQHRCENLSVTMDRLAVAVYRNHTPASKWLRALFTGLPEIREPRFRLGFGVPAESLQTIDVRRPFTLTTRITGSPLEKIALASSVARVAESRSCPRVVRRCRVGS